MSNFSVPDRFDVVYQVRDMVLEKWHQRLHDADVQIYILFASASGGKPPLKKNGYAVAAMIKPMSPQLRAIANADALLLIDESFWEDLEEPSRLALMDHEISHLDIIDEESVTGKLIAKRDDAGRPKLRSVPGDWNGGDGFRAVIARHGEHAIEFENSRRVFSVAKAAKEAYEQNQEEELEEAVLSFGSQEEA